MTIRRRRVIPRSFLVAVLGMVVWWWRDTPDEESEDLGFGTMYDRIATRYDLANRVMSLGLDQSWRRYLVARLELQKEDRVLDLATGTADVAMLEAVTVQRVRGIDPSENMLQIGREKVKKANLNVT